jgi:hypothetical protein
MIERRWPCELHLVRACWLSSLLLNHYIIYNAICIWIINTYTSILIWPSNAKKN